MGVEEPIETLCKLLNTQALQEFPLPGRVIFQAFILVPALYKQRNTGKVV
ncbi:MAG: hypothetical protein LBU25_04580 [Treponema sp.]|nr:hypothetical protein [Treponema sp.]